MLSMILKAILEFLFGYFEKKRLMASEHRAKVEAGKLRSVIKTKKVEECIKTAKPLRPSRSPSEWNKKALFPLLFLLSFLIVACQPVIFVESRWPIIPKSEKPILPEDPPEFTLRELILVDYAEELELRIEVFNENASEHNRENGYE